MKRMIFLVLMTILLAACARSVPEVDLAGEWVLVSYGDAANPTPALEGVDTNITFMDGQVSGNVGCNGFGGDYQLKGNTLTFGSIMSTLMYCEKTANQEQGVLAVLNGSVTVTRDGNILTLTAQDGQVLNLALRNQAD